VACSGSTRWPSDHQCQYPVLYARDSQGSGPDRRSGQCARPPRFPCPSRRQGWPLRSSTRIRVAGVLAENGVVFAPLLLDGLKGDRLGVVAKAICDLPRTPPSWFAELQTLGISQLQRVAPSVKHHKLPGMPASDLSLRMIRVTASASRTTRCGAENFTSARSCRTRGNRLAYLTQRVSGMGGLSAQLKNPL